MKTCEPTYWRSLQYHADFGKNPDNEVWFETASLIAADPSPRASIGYGYEYADLPLK